MDPEVTNVPVKPGDVLADKYKVQRVLGAGAMGVVVAATHLELGNRVALKFMLPQALSGPDAVERFIKEARAASQLSSNHVCRVSDVGRLANGAPYIVMEYLEGKDLYDVLRERGPLPISVAASYLVQVCDAMSEAHAAGIVHRDLKPQNLFITTKRNGTQVLKVLDFGISKGGIGSAGFAQTHTAAIMGSPAYMSPEQLRSSKSVDGRADIWAMGVILYQLTLGRLPFEAEDFLGLAWAATNDAPAAPRTIREAMPAEFETIILRCLEKDREKRYADADELAAALSPFAAQLPRATSEPADKSKQGASAASGTGAGNASLDATRAPPSLTAPNQGNETVAPPIQKASPSPGSPTAPARPGAKAMSLDPVEPGAPPVATAGSAPFAGRSTLSGSIGEMASGKVAPAARSRKWIVAGAGGAVVAAVAVVIAISGGKGAGSVTQPAGAPEVPALVDQAPPVAAPVAAPEPTPVAAPPDAGVAVAATPITPVTAPGKPDKDKDKGRGKKPKVEPAKPVPVVKVDPPKDPPPKVDPPKPDPPADPPKVEPKVEPKPEKPKPKPRDEDEFSR